MMFHFLEQMSYQGKVSHDSDVLKPHSTHATFKWLVTFSVNLIISYSTCSTVYLLLYSYRLIVHV